LTDAVAFGSVDAGGNYSTIGGSPGPFRIENTGNIFFNATINATPFFTAVPMNSTYYRFKVRENSTELGSIDTALSYTEWISMNYTSSVFHAVELNWRDITDEFLTDINISVPTNESAEAKTSVISFLITGSGIG
ncbi:MAG: hypothetical protein AABX05_02610, partial [Nanoarchaeota archaeon]